MFKSQIDLLIDKQFIEYSAQCYQWAIEYEQRLREMVQSKRFKIKRQHSGRNYFDIAVTIVNQEFKDDIKKANIPKITETDLMRSYQIVKREIPTDVIGLVYVWFIHHAPLYLHKRDGETIYGDDVVGDDVRMNHFFKKFILWVDREDRVTDLSLRPTDPILVDELQGIFHRVVKVMVEKNIYLQGLFEDEPPIPQVPSDISHHIEGVLDKVQETVEHLKRENG